MRYLLLIALLASTARADDAPLLVNPEVAAENRRILRKNGISVDTGLILSDIGVVTPLTDKMQSVASRQIGAFHRQCMAGEGFTIKVADAPTAAMKLLRQARQRRWALVMVTFGKTVSMYALVSEEHTYHLLISAVPKSIGVYICETKERYDVLPTEASGRCDALDAGIFRAQVSKDVKRLEAAGRARRACDKQVK